MQEGVTDDRLVARENLLDRIGNFAQTGAGLRRFDREFQQVAVVARLGGTGDRFEQLLNAGVVTLGAKFLEPFDLRSAHRRIVDRENVDRIFMLQAELVDSDNRLGARVDACLLSGSSLFDAHLGQPGFNGLGHAA